MARVRRRLQADQRPIANNINLAPRGPTANMEEEDQFQEHESAPEQDPEGEQDTDSSAPGPSTRIPDTLNINAAATPPTPPAALPVIHQPLHARLGITEEQNLRIRNAFQREEVRSANRAIREAYTQMGQMETAAERNREQILEFQAELRWTRRWMEWSFFFAVLLFVLMVMYAGWCWVNSAEFEFQRRVVRRRYGLE